MRQNQIQHSDSNYAVTSNYPQLINGQVFQAEIFKRKI